ncbi:MAG: Peptidylprolyl isomerase, partial [Bacteroidetes bacterium]|nr:Peptidylprolyl isomerase [Bacteroidota bacterium]
MLLVIGMLPMKEARAQFGNVPVGVVAKAGDTFISEKEFLERFEMLPGLQRRREGRMEETKLELLYSLIAEKLMSQEARERQLHLDSTFRLSFEEVRKMLARDQLYREEVSGKVRIGSNELEQALAQAVKEILISFIYCDRQADAVFLRKQIKTSRDFDSIQIDTSFHAVRDTATVIWSDANPDIERAAYSMKKGEVSSVIRAGTGYYILKVVRVQKSDFYTSLQPSVLREKVQEKVRERKEEARLSDFVASVLKHKVGYSRPVQLKALASALRKVFAAGQVEGKVALTENSAAEVRRECRAMLEDTLSVAGDIVWTVGDIVDRLYTTGFSVDSTTVKSIHHLLNGQLRVWVQQEL